MSREIKFRDWDNACGKMRSINGVKDFFGLRSDGEHYGDFEIMQYTGLTDKNGKQIYEGDILKFVTNGFDAETFITTIIFDKCSFKLQNNRALFYFGQSDFTKVDDAIVIGNVFENPEML